MPLSMGCGVMSVCANRLNRFNAHRNDPILTSLLLSDVPFMCRKYGFKVRICRMITCDLYIKCHRGNEHDQDKH